MNELKNPISLDELEKEKARLEQEINRIKKTERKHKIKEIVQIMQLYSITLDEVNIAINSNVAKYRDDVTGQTWSGRGKKPAWVVALINNGGNIDDYLIK